MPHIRRIRQTVAVDSETTGLRPFRGDRPFAVSLCWDDGRTEYFEWPVDPHTRQVSPNKRDLQKLQKILGDRAIRKVFHNASFDLKMLESIGLEVRGGIEDTLIAAHICDSALPSYGLKWLARRLLDIGDDDESDLKEEVKRCRRIAKQQGWNIADNLEADYWLPRAIDPTSGFCQRYAIRDAERTMHLWKFCEASLDGLKVRHSYEFEMRKLFPVIQRMEQRGLRIDLDVNRSERRRYERMRDCSLRALQKAAGDRGFNPNSSKQVAALLFEKLGLRIKPSLATAYPSRRWPYRMETNSSSIPTFAKRVNGRDASRATIRICRALLIPSQHDRTFPFPHAHPLGHARITSGSVRTIPNWKPASSRRFPRKRLYLRRSRQVVTCTRRPPTAPGVNYS